jgi:hypothetical protein
MAIPSVNSVFEVIGLYDQDAARGVTDNSLRHRSHQDGPQAGSSVCAHNHQVRPMAASELDDSWCMPTVLAHVQFNLEFARLDLNGPENVFQPIPQSVLVFICVVRWEFQIRPMLPTSLV